MAQLASASGLGPEGPVFESQYPDKKRDVEKRLFFCRGTGGAKHPCTSMPRGSAPIILEDLTSKSSSIGFAATLYA